MNRDHMVVLSVTAVLKDAIISIVIWRHVECVQDGLEQIGIVFLSKIFDTHIIFVRCTYEKSF